MIVRQKVIWIDPGDIGGAYVKINPDGTQDIPYIDLNHMLASIKGSVTSIDEVTKLALLLLL